MSIKLIIGSTSGPSGRRLQAAIQNAGGVLGNGPHIVSYGVYLTPSPTVLNARAGATSKYTELQTLQATGIRVPTPYTPQAAAQLPQSTFPLLARKITHMGGKDIRPVFQQEEVPWRAAAGAAYFVPYIPWKTEYRVWVFRDSHLGTYEKVMTRPHEYKTIGHNHKNGFKFQLVQEDRIPRDAVAAAKTAIKALRLDFGAVDIIHAKDGNPYVLEVNTAPGVDNEDTQVIRGLARHIVKWANA